MPAMPQLIRDPWDKVSAVGGLTKREYFAALALQGFMANPHVKDDAEAFAKRSVRMADALLKELGEK